MRPGFFLTPDTWNLSMVYLTTDKNITLIRDEPKIHEINVDLLTKNTDRDPLAGTPHHRYIPCRVEECD